MPDGEPADHRPPHPVDRKLREEILEAVDERRQETGPEARDEPRRRARRPALRRRAARAGATGKIGPLRGAARAKPRRRSRPTATGMKLRGFHSKSSSSTASSTAAIGVAKIADMPAAAPATSSVLRSADERWKSCAKSEPNAPPVMMIGPSAPNGPPVPMEMADETGFKTATFGVEPAAPDQDRLERLGNSVAADLLRAEARHETDDQAADDGHENRPDPEVMAGGRDERRGEALVVGEVRDHGDQPDERLRPRARRSPRWPSPSGSGSRRGDRW